MKVPTVTLNNGLKMPQLGLGVWQIEDHKEVKTAVSAALEVGYRAIDTAAMYNNEEGVGEAIQASGLPREDIFVTSKLDNEHHGYDAAMRGFDDSIRKLGLTYLDLYLIHWPMPEQDDYVETWQALEELHQQGRIKAIGVSNFKQAHLDKLLGSCDVVPAVNQIELHPHFNQKAMRDYCRERDIYVESWSPIKRGGDVLNDKVVQSIADNHGKTGAQVVLRWHIQHGLIVIPKSRTPARIKENIDIFDFKLSDEEMAAIDDLGQGERIGPDPGVS